MQDFDLPVAKSGSYQVQKLNDTHMAIIRLLITGTYSNNEIAEILGVTPAMVVYTKQSPIVQQKLSVFRAILDHEAIDTARMIQDLHPVAITRMGEMLTNRGTDEKLVVQIAKDLLDRGGFAPPKQAELHLHATVSDIEEIKAIAKSRGRDTGIVEDAKFTETPDE